MPIQIACPECDKKYRVPDDRAGGEIECKECGATISIPGGSRRRATSRDDDDEPSTGRRRPKKSGRGGKRKGSPNTLLIAGGIGGVIVVGLVAILLMRRPPANNVQPVAGAQMGPNTVVSNTVAPNTTASVNTSTPPSPRAGGTDVVVKDWRAKVDPPSVPIPSDPIQPFQIQTEAKFGLGPNHLVYPDVPSPFVLVGQAGQPKDPPRELWNLVTGTNVGQIAPSKRRPNKIGLSPDGKLLAWYRHDDGGGLDVFDIGKGEIILSIPLPSAETNVNSVSFPSNQRLVVGSFVHKKLMTWKMPTGEPERTIPLGENSHIMKYLAFSPGGQFAALTGDFLTHTLKLIDLNTGNVAGTIEFTDKMINQGLVGLAFSPDGAELAAAFGQNHGATSDRILIWDVAKGTTVADFRLPDPDQRPLDVGTSQQALEWFPDRKRLLQNGRYVIDRDSKKVVFSLPKPSLQFEVQTTRHVLTNTVVAAWEGSKEAATLAPMELKESDLARAREVASSGGLVVDAKLPKLTPFDDKPASNKSTVDKMWKVQPDPASGAANLTASISVSDATARLRELKFSRLDVGRAALRLATGENDTKAVLYGAHPRTVPVEGAGRTRRRFLVDPVPCQQNSLELFDLSQGKSIGKTTIGFPCELVALSPDGSRALVAAMDGQGRLDAYSLPDGTHIAGCRPFAGEPKAEHRHIESAAFLDQATVAACSKNDQLVVFKLPGCEPIYTAKDAGALALSPGGKLLATCAQGKIDFRDPLTGDGRGSVNLAGDALALSFSPKGDRLAVVTTGGGGSQTHVIALKDGTVSSLNIPAAMPLLLWVGDDQLLIGAEKASEFITRVPRPATIDRHMLLVDLRRQAVLWSYDYGTGDRVTFDRSTFDGRLWVAGDSVRAGGPQLNALALPEAAIAAKLDDKTLDAKLAVKPGMSVSLQFNVTDPAELPGFSQQVRGMVEASLRNNGLAVKNGQPINLVVAATVANGSSPLVVEMLSGAKNPQPINLQSKNVTVRMAYESNGQVIWESKQEATNGMVGLISTASNKTPQQAVDEEMWKRAVDVFQQSQPPSHILTGTTNRGLGTSRLAGDGVYPP